MGMCFTNSNDRSDIDVQQLKSIDIVECAIEGQFKSPILNKRLLEKKTNDKVDSTSNNNVINLINSNKT